ncbi:non-ribosomal peptide synthetase [Streptomyces sp. 11x1]|uniref:non-ribosomal peptide synthetase n=1 Tax=Streptomyces sp. 11x1 TaxID=3038642 RepID=UPI00292FF60A|nr:non-ribosomal peptide synthetase [Streptomyces sp. 11x1]WNZ08509.1 amino acid adenylation domain-containing protein [Streptomyces sp. 11x1]
MTRAGAPAGRPPRQDVEYWRRRLAGIPPLDLPTDRRRSVVRSTETSTYAFEVPRATAEALRALADRQDSDLRAVFVAGIQALFTRYLGQSDVAVGTLAPRTSHTVVLRTEAGAHDSFEDLVTRVRDTAQEAFAHDVSLARLVEELAPEQDTSVTPFVQAMVVVRDGEQATAAFDPLDLALEVAVVDGALPVSVHYNSVLFDHSTIVRIVGHLTVLLAGAAVQPELPVSALPMLSPGEFEQVVHGWNTTERSVPTGTFPDLFAAQVRTRPDAVAALDEYGPLTYRELDERSSRIAHHLLDLGVSRGDLVGLCVERGTWLVAGMLGVMKAGAAYVPLDPNYPEERLAYMLRDSGVGYVVTQETVAGGLPPTDAVLVPVDRDHAVLDRRPVTAPEVALTPEDLAYVIYTSGSTGRPKGVLVTHRGIGNLVAAQTEAFDVTPDSKVLQFASASFDAAFWEICMGVLTGACLVMGSEESLQPGEPLAAYTAKHGVTHATLTPTTVAVLPEGRGLPAGATLVVAGEAATGDLVDRWSAGRLMINAYGPTETTVCATMSAPLSGAEVPPIGSPIANTRVYVLDDLLRPVPVGVRGELYIAGPGLARGYHGRPGTTAERFVADPFDAHGSRMYRTGDVVRRRADGTLEYLARVDDQVKVRGFRVELGEIESLLTRRGDVAQAVVVTHNTNLLAYVVPSGRVRPTGGELREYLAVQLPEYMVPAAITVLDALPLTPNGKVNRLALPTLEAPRDGGRGPGYEAPRNAVEETIANVWAEVLEVERVGIHDEFFALGGNSLLSVRAASRLRQALGIRLSLRVLFDSPTVAALAELLSSAEESAEAAIPVISREGLLPMSYGQRRLWFLENFAPGSAEYHTGLGLRLTGALDLDALRDAMRDLTARHEVLRTTFGAVGGQGVQVVYPSLDPQWQSVDLSGVPERLREERLRELVRAQMARPYDLQTGPLVRVLLVRLAEREHVCVLGVHHIVTDGWSSGVIARELSALYTTRVRGTRQELPDLTVQYADFAAWQRGRTEGSALVGRHLAWWRERLAGVTPLDLPTDRPRPAVRSTTGAEYHFELPSGLTARARELAAQRGATLFMALTAAVKAVFAHWSGQEDIAVGTATSGRGHRELEQLVGFLVNTVVLRTRVEQRMSFGELLDRIKETVLDAFAHEDVPFEQVVEAVQPERDTSRTPLIQTMVVLQNTPRGDVRMPEVEYEPYPVEHGAAPFDLTVEFTEADDRLYGRIIYSTALFDEATVARLVGNLTVLLDAAADSPEQEVSALPLLTEAEHARLVHGWNDTARPLPENTLPELFTAQVARQPNAVAVSFGDTDLTYRELDERADRLAGRLLAAGAGPGLLVGLCLERGTDAVVAMLAVLKAGAAYLPLDPGYPAERLSYMLDDARVRLLLTQRRLRERLPDTDAAILDLDELGDPGDSDVKGAEAGGDVSRVAVSPDDLAYVIYTSGSTGGPKGVLTSHHAVVRLAHQSGIFDLAPGDTVAQLASLSFDAATLEVWGALLNGARLAVHPPTTPTGQELKTFLTRHQVTHLAIAAGLFAHVVDDDVTALSGLRQVVAGGDKLSPEHAARVLAVHPGLRLANGYGPTEATSLATTYRLVLGMDPATPVPLGTPVGNTRAYVLTASLRPAPVGVPGELYLAGPGLAQGYLGRPALTAERFVADPFGEPGSRMYCSGDLARRRADGVLEFLGRADRQVKIRGFRIELGEVESALKRHPDVTDAVVVAHEDAPGRRRLVAYAAGTPALDGEVLRAHLAATLPEHMTPALFVPLERLPLTSNGKVDLRALPGPEVSALRPGAEYTAPEDGPQAVLAKVWSQVLGVERVGAHDNFFELGGDSILSLQVVSRARQAGLHLTSRMMFVHQTVAALAAAVGTVADEEPAAESVKVSGPVALTPIQRRFFEDHREGPDHYTMSTRVALAPDTDTALLERALAVTVAHHDALRMRFRRTGSNWTQEYGETPDAAMLLTVRDLSGLDEADWESALEEAAAAARLAVDLSAGVLARGVFFRLGAGRLPVLFLTAHHLVMDGVSWRVILEDLSTVYAQLTQGLAAGAPSRTSSYQTWAARLAEHARAGGFDAELPYWREVTDRAAGVPRDGDAPNTFGSAEVTSVLLGREETRDLLQRVPAAYRTQINDVLLTALGRVLGRWAGAPVTIALEGHGREDLFDGVDLSRTVGWFTTAFPVTLDVPTTDWGAALKAMKENIRAVPGHGLGYGALRHLPGPDGRPRFGDPVHEQQVSFNYLGQWDGSAQRDGLVRGRLEPLGREQADGLPRPHLIDIVAAVSDGELRVDWIHSPGSHATATVERLAGEFLAALRDLVQHCLADGSGGATPSDFPLAGLDQAGVDRVVGDGRNVADVYPLTPMQAGMLFHTLSDPEGTSYVERMTYVLDGVRDPEVLSEAWQHTADGLEALRTQVVWEGVERPLAVVRRRVELPVDQVDWRGLSAVEQEEALGRMWDETPRLDMRTAPLAQLTLIRLTNDSVRVVCAFHHLLFDGWSMFSVLTQVHDAYTALAAGRTPALMSRQPFRAYVEWLERQDGAQAEEFWRGRLAGFTTPNALPYDRLPPTGHTSRSTARLFARLSPEDSAALAAFARTHRLTLNTLVQGAWALLLSRCSGERDVVFGATVSGRPADLTGVDSIAGMLINTLPVRVGIGEEAAAASVADWLTALQREQVEARQYDYVPLSRVRDWSSVERGTGLFESLVVFENYPRDVHAEDGDGPHLRALTGMDITHFPLNLLAYDAEELAFTLAYDPALFDEDTVANLARSFTTLLTGLAADPQRSPAELPALSDDEVEQVVREWGHGPRTRPVDGTVHGLVARQAAATPDATALSYSEVAVSYRELEEQANRFAHHLISLGAAPGGAVGVSALRGPDLVVALLAVLKTGAAYVPVDPAYPADRRAFMLRDSGAGVLVSDGFSETPEVAGLTVTRLDLPSVAGLPGTAPDTRVSGDDLAYVIYTSGSTGRPKGVAVEHRSVLNLLAHSPASFGLGAGEVWSAFHSYAFDVSVWEMWGCLTTGGRLVLIPQDWSREPRAAWDLLHTEGVSVLSQTPSMFRTLVEDGAPTATAVELPKLRWVFLAGEALEPKHLSAWFDRHGSGGARVVNVYGPTEATVYVTYQEITADDVAAGGPLPIGRPLPGYQVLVLDEASAPVPAGVTGELYIAGAGLARGYLNRPELTEELFPGHPFGESGERVYRSGDLVRWRSDGTLVYLGRRDGQVKIRGFRIEAGEVEAALVSLPAVRDAAVVAHTDGERTVLVAHVVTVDGSAPDASEVRSLLAGRLPEFMLPTVVNRLDELPLTPSGKVDRRALPAPSVPNDSQGARIAPRTVTEEAVAEIWAELMGSGPAGIHDDFFTNGGDSLLAIRVVSRLNTAFGLGLSPRVLFDRPTVALIAHEIEERVLAELEEGGPTP